MTDSKKQRDIDLENKGSSTLYGLWSVGFLSSFMNIAIIMSSGKVNNVIGLLNWPKKSFRCLARTDSFFFFGVCVGVYPCKPGWYQIEKNRWHLQWEMNIGRESLLNVSVLEGTVCKKSRNPKSSRKSEVIGNEL